MESLGSARHYSLLDSGGNALGVRTMNKTIFPGIYLPVSVGLRTGYIFLGVKKQRLKA